MALTTIQDNNKLVQYSKEIRREYVRENLFSPYMGSSMTSIIRILSEPKKGGEQINIPLVGRLFGGAKSTGTLVGNEESIRNFGHRVYVDWARHAVATNDAEEQKDSADVFGEVKPLLSDWGKELQRDEIILAMHAIPSLAEPAGLGSTNGQRVNGILYKDAVASDRNTWHTDNADRVLYGDAVSNYVPGNHNNSLATITAGMKFSAKVLKLAKRRARMARPRIRPFKLKDGREYYVCFVGSDAFRDFISDPEVIQADLNGRARENGGMNSNPLFQDGDRILNGVIVREIPEMDELTKVTGKGAGGIDVAPYFLCGQQAIAVPWAKEPTPTFKKEDDYQFLKGAGVKMCYGVAKLAAKFPDEKNPSSEPLKDWGVFTGYVAAAADADIAESA